MRVIIRMKIKVNQLENIKYNKEIKQVPNNFFIMMNCFLCEYSLSNNIVCTNDEIYSVIRDYFTTNNVSSIYLYQKLLKLEPLKEIVLFLPKSVDDIDTFVNALDFSFESTYEKNVFRINKEFLSKKMFLSFVLKDNKHFYLRYTVMDERDISFSYSNDTYNFIEKIEQPYLFNNREKNCSTINDESFFVSCKEISELDELQKDIVRFGDTKNLVVLAGAGSGKTRTLCARFLYYHFVKGIPLEKMLMVTFTKRAADGMKSKALKLYNEIKKDGIMPCDINAKTIDSFIRELIQVFYFEIGFTSKPQYKIGLKYKIEYQKVISNLIKENSIRFKGINKENPVINDGFINNLNIILRNDEIIDSNYSVLVKLLIDYQIKNNVIFDFSFANIIILDALNNNPTLVNKLEQLYDVILIDEFQDINNRQNLLFKFLYDSNNIEFTFVGDDDQSIYFWRGSNNEIIKNIKDREDTTQKFLNINYRNNPYIVQAGNAVLAHINDRSKVGKTIISSKKSGEKIRLISDDSLYNNVINEVENLVLNGIKPGNIAILSRFGIGLTSDEPKSLNYIVQGLESKKISYQIKNSDFDLIKYYQIVKLIIFGALSLNEAYGQARQTIDYFGPIYFSEHIQLINEMSLLDAVFHNSEKAFPSDILSFVKKLKNVLDGLKNINYSSLNEMIEFLIYKISDEFLSNGGILLSNQFFKQLIKFAIEMSIDISSNLSVIVKFFESFESLSSDNNRDDIDTDDLETVKVSTIHGFKGLEFDYVFLIDLNEKSPSFPNFYRLKKEREEKENELKQIISESTEVIKNNDATVKESYYKLIHKSDFVCAEKVRNLILKFSLFLKSEINLSHNNGFVLNLDNINTYLMGYKIFIVSPILNPLNNSIGTIQKEMDKLANELNGKLSKLYGSLSKDDFERIKKEETERFNQRNSELLNKLTSFIKLKNMVDDDTRLYTDFYNKVLICQSAFRSLSLKNDIELYLKKLDIELEKKEEEEKKLFYVAITRASEVLYFAYNNIKSEFIKLIPSDLMIEYCVKESDNTAKLKSFVEKYNNIFSKEIINDQNQRILAEDIFECDYLINYFKSSINSFINDYSDFMTINSNEKIYMKNSLIYYFLSKRVTSNFEKGFVYNIYYFVYNFLLNRFKNLCENKISIDSKIVVSILDECKTIKPLISSIDKVIDSDYLSLEKMGILLYENYKNSNDKEARDLLMCCYDISNCFKDYTLFDSNIYDSDLFEYLIDCVETIIKDVNTINKVNSGMYLVGSKVYSKKYGIGILEKIDKAFCFVSFDGKITKIMYFDIDIVSDNNQKNSPIQLFKQSIDKIVEIEARFEESISAGTGFYIDSNHIMTNAHVILHDYVSSYITAKKYKENTVIELSVILYDVENDVAILESKEKNSFLSFTCVDVENGEEVYAIGNSLGQGLNILCGNVSDFKRFIGNKEFIMCNLGTTHGNSGGPILNNKGDVVGMLTLGNKESQSMNYAIPWYILNRIIKQNNL